MNSRLSVKSRKVLMEVSLISLVEIKWNKTLTFDCTSNWQRTEQQSCLELSSWLLPLGFLIAPSRLHNCSVFMIAPSLISDSGLMYHIHAVVSCLTSILVKWNECFSSQFSDLKPNVWISRTIKRSLSNSLVQRSVNAMQCSLIYVMMFSTLKYASNSFLIFCFWSLEPPPVMR